MRIDKDGNVGIGTTAPTEKLEVAGNLELSASFKILSDSGSWWQRIRTVDSSTLTDDAFNFEVRKGSGDYTNLMAIENSGNVGIGTTSPGVKFHIAQDGTISDGTTSQLRISGTTINL